MIVRAPGRVNLIGDHTDHTGGLVLPMAIDRWTTITIDHADDGTIDRIELSSADELDCVSLALPIDEPAAVMPAWGRYVAGVAAEMGSSATGFAGRVSTDLPIGAGLSSSAALELVSALALGFTGTATELALICQRAEHRASGVPCGIMDQLCCAAGVAGAALLIDCHELSVTPIPLPTGIDVIVQFVQHRTLSGSEYVDRVAECAAAEAAIGPLRVATAADVERIDDALARRRARHVVSENERVRACAAALRDGDAAMAGQLMGESHASLRDDFGTSTAAMDAAVARLTAMAGVHGARMTGGGFGGCVVALCDADVTESIVSATGGWHVRAVDGALTSGGTP